MIPRLAAVLLWLTLVPPAFAQIVDTDDGLVQVEGLVRRTPQDVERLIQEKSPGTTLSSGACAGVLKRELAPGRNVIHFAGHGIISDREPLASALLLAPGDGQDGYLRTPEIFALDLDADLVILSGCSTGLGKLSGDGVLGLSRAFLYAGTPAVIVSQWDVSDQATAELMERFYAAYRGDFGVGSARSAAHALRTAQRALLERHPHPYLWAAFELIGRAP